MSKRLICSCGFELKSATSYCLNCGKRNALACGIYNSDKRLYIFFVGRFENEVISFKKYEEEQSIRNTFEIAGEKIYERRIEEIYVSGRNEKDIDEVFYWLRDFVYPFKLIRTDTFENESEFFSRLEKFIKVKSKLKTVDIPPEKKIHGSHSTIIGEREGYSLILKIASSPYVKKIVPGVIENKGIASGGVRLKLTRCDEKGNIKALLIDGATVQQIYVITTASNKDEGEQILKMLKSLKF